MTWRLFFNIEGIELTAEGGLPITDEDDVWIFFFSFSLSQSRSSLLMSSTSLIVFFRSFSECPRFKRNLESILQFCIYSVVSEQMRLMRMNPFGKFLVTDDVSDDLMIHLSASYNRSHLPE